MAITVTQTEIGAPDGGGLELTFEDFVLEDDEGCNFDFVQVRMMVRMVMVMVNYHNGGGEDIDGDYCAPKLENWSINSQALRMKFASAYYDRR